MHFIKNHILYLAWIVATSAMLGSLYFSNILGFPPCVLCWYQRIAMYPLVLILGMGIIRRDKNVAYYALPLSGIGLIISVYHNLLYYQMLPHSVEPCTFGISCTTKFIEWFGFITIPFLSLMAFSLITASLILYHTLNKNHVERS